MLSGAARKNYAEQDAAARRNQLSMTKLRQMCESDEFQAAKRRDAPAVQASEKAVPIMFKRDAPEASLEAARARLAAARTTNYMAELEQSRVRARAIPEDESDDDDHKWEGFVSRFDLPAATDDQSEESEDDPDLRPPVLAWGPSGRSAGLLTNSDGNLRLVAFLTACPSIITGTIYTVRHPSATPPLRPSLRPVPASDTLACTCT